MRLKEHPLCCAFAWAPKRVDNTALIAAASYYGAMDDFDSDPVLQICQVDVTRTDETGMPVKGSVSLPARACRVDWSASTLFPDGLIAVACENGVVYLFAAATILAEGRAAPSSSASPPSAAQAPAAGANGTRALVGTIKAHQGPVRGCQFNHAKPELLATGGAEGHWFIWNLAKAKDGNGATTVEATRVCVVEQASVGGNNGNNNAVVDLQWHPRYSHIIGIATSANVVQVWNLKTTAMASSLNVSKSAKGASLTCLAWNPLEATKLAVGLDGGHPVLQMWDLKCALQPTSELAGHRGGITALAWNIHDATELASCGEDGHTISWDFRKGVRVGELEVERVPVVGVQWCPVVPHVLATASFGPLLCVASAEDGAGGMLAMEEEGAGAEASAAAPGAAPATTPTSASTTATTRPCRASVNFLMQVASLVPGTKHTLRLTTLPPAPLSPRTRDDLALRQELSRIPADSPDRVAWLEERHYGLLAAVASARTSRQPILTYLSQPQGKPRARRQASDAAGDSATRRHRRSMSLQDGEEAAGEEMYDGAAKTGAAANDEDDDPFAELTAEQQKSYTERAAEEVARGELAAAVEVCMGEERYDDAFAIAFLAGGELLKRVHERYMQHVAEAHAERRHVLLAGAVATNDYSRLLSADVPWREALSTIVAFVGDGFAEACNRLGDTLRGRNNMEGAYTCYVCARNVDAVVELWQAEGLSSRQVVRDAMLLEETTERAVTGPFFAQCLYRYGLKLVVDGHLQDAMTYLQRAAGLGEANAQVLVDRVAALLRRPAGQEGDVRASFPFQADPIADEPSESCRAFLYQLQEAQQQQLQQQQQQLQQQQLQQQQLQQQQQQQQRPPAQARPPSTSYAPPQPMPYQPALQPAVRPTGEMPGGAAMAYRPPAPAATNHNAMTRPLAMPPGPAVPPPQPASLIPASYAPPPSRGPSMNGPVMGTVVANTPPPPPPQPSMMPPSAAAVGQTAPMRPLQPPQSVFAGRAASLDAPAPRLMPHPVSSYSSLRPASASTQPPFTAAPTSSGPYGPAGSAAVAPPRAGSLPVQGGGSSSDGGGTAPLTSNARATAQPPPPPPSSSLSPQYGGNYATAPPAPMPGSGVRGASLAAAMQPPPSSAYAPPRQQQQQQAPTAMMPPPPPRASPAPIATRGVAEIDSTQLSTAVQQQLVQRLQQLIPHIADSRRRAAVEQSASELCHMLMQGAIPEPMQQQLLQYVNAAGTPASRTLWEQLSRQNFSLIRGFINLRFL